MSIQIVKIKRALTQAVGAPNKNGRFRCPSHGGYDFNLALRDTAKKVQITCFSHGCSAKSILESVGLSMSDMYYERVKNNEYITAQTKDRLTPGELNYEIAIIDTHAKILANSHIKLYAFEINRVKVAKARLLRHHARKQEVSQ